MCWSIRFRLFGCVECSLLGSVTVIGGLYILLWGKDRELQKQETEQVQETHQEIVKEDQKPEFQLVITSD